MHAEIGGGNERDVSGGKDDRKHATGKQILRRLSQRFAILRVQFFPFFSFCFFLCFKLLVLLGDEKDV